MPTVKERKTNQPGAVAVSAGPAPKMPPPVVAGEQSCLLMGKESLPQQVRAALGDVHRARQAGERGIWQEVFAVGLLRAACEEQGLKYLVECQRHLALWGATANSPARLSALSGLCAYMQSKGLTQIPDDITTWPTFSQALPLAKAVRHPKRAAVKKDQVEHIHSQVFDPDPAKRPPASNVRMTIGKIFAPPKPETPKPTPQPGLEPERVTKKSMESWYKANQSRGCIQIHRVRLARLTADALAVAIKANWKALKSANLIKVEVVKKGAKK